MNAESHAPIREDAAERAAEKIMLHAASRRGGMLNQFSVAAAINEAIDESVRPFIDGDQACAVARIKAQEECKVLREAHRRAWDLVNEFRKARQPVGDAELAAIHRCLAQSRPAERTGMRVYYFGCLGPNDIGHFLYKSDGGQLFATYSDHLCLPFRYEILDGGLLPQNQPEEQGLIHRSEINGWTVLTMWDRTADKRGRSNASFVIEGVMDTDSAMAVAQSAFPQLWARIKPIKSTTRAPGKSES